VCSSDRSRTVLLYLLLVPYVHQYRIPPMRKMPVPARHRTPAGDEPTSSRNSRTSTDLLPALGLCSCSYSTRISDDAQEPGEDRDRCQSTQHNVGAHRQCPHVHTRTRRRTTVSA